MIFPYADDQVHHGYKPVFSILFIILNILIFAWMVFYLDQEGIHRIYMEYGSIPAAFIAGEDWLTLFSAMFLHGGLIHLAGNMVFLFVFADNIEASVGSTRFLIFYLLGGIVAGLAHILFNTGSQIPAIGASGAISAVLGAYLIMFPASRIRVFILILFSRANIPAFLFLGIWIIQQLVSGIGSMGGAHLESGGVAWWAHIGGFFYGIVAGFYLRPIMQRNAEGPLV